MGKKKVYEIAKELGLTSKEIIAKANEIGISVTSHANAVSAEQERDIKNAIKGKKSTDNKKQEKKKEEPVIIRKSVIITDEESEKKKKDKNENEKTKNVDLKFVHRNKPNKPLTASELFGRDKKEDKAEKSKKTENSKTDKNSDNSKKLDKNIENSKNEVMVKQENKVNSKEDDNKNKQAKIQKENIEQVPQNKELKNDQKQENKSGANQELNKEVKNDKVQNNEYRNNKNDDGQGKEYRNNINQNGQNRDYRNNRKENDLNKDFRKNRNENGQNKEYRNNRNQNGKNRDYKNNKNENGQNRDYKNSKNENGQNKEYRNNRNQNGQNKDYKNNRNQNGQNKDCKNNRNRDNNFRARKPLDEKGIDKNIKNIMSNEVVEKENQRDYSSKVMDKKKNNRFEEKTKKQNKNKKASRFDDNYNSEKLKNLKQENRLSNMFNEQEGGMLDYYDLSTERGKRNKKRNTKDNEPRTKQKIFKLTEITIPETIQVKDLAMELKKTSGEVITKLIKLGVMATINNDIDFDTAFIVAQEFGVTAIKKEVVKEEDILFDESEDKVDELQERPPVVVVMGHVDHGKTSLLDAIRKTNVIEGEAGGITQHIGAYKVTVNDREITFLDTPGHEAFTSMRARGAQITDIAILIVAANDGVMPQTVEAINHAKAAGIPIVVAVNKIDLPGANVDKVKQDLMKYELVAEEWGGDTIFVPISAKQGTNIDQLLEMVLLVADMKELKANPKKQAKGAIIEARLDKAKGPIATVLVQRGTLDIGDTIVVGSSIGRIRAMKNDKGQKVKKAGPSTPVEIMGLTEVPEAGDTFYEVKDEKMAKHLIERRKRQAREKSINQVAKLTLDDLFAQIEKGHLKQLNIIVKADVQGSAEAIKQSLEKLSDDEVKVKVIHSNAGGVTESDVKLAKVANAIIIAFNVRPNAIVKQEAEKEDVEIKQYSIIYQAIEDVKLAMKGLLDPIYQEKVIGNAEVRQVFKVSNVGTIAGCYVLDGKVERNAGIRVIRDDIVIHEGKLISLKRFKDDAKEVARGYECGIQIENYNDLKEGDNIEVYIMEEVKR